MIVVYKNSGFKFLGYQKERTFKTENKQTGQPLLSFLVTLTKKRKIE
jgi:hypothetical protein